jgi:hypothetical protein
MNIAEFFKNFFNDNTDRWQRNFEPRKVSKHKARAKQPKRDAARRAKTRRKMAKQSRRINRSRE